MSGRPTLLDDALHEKAIHYIENHKDVYNDEVPSHAGMAVVLKVSKSTIYKWAEDERETSLGSFSDTLDMCNQKQEALLVSNGLNNTFNSTIAKLMLHNHGHSDRSSTDVTSGGKPIKNEWHMHPTSNDK